MYALLAWVSVVAATVSALVGAYKDFIVKESEDTEKWWNSSIALFLLASLNFSYV